MGLDSPGKSKYLPTQSSVGWFRVPALPSVAWPQDLPPSPGSPDCSSSDKGSHWVVMGSLWAQPSLQEAQTEPQLSAEPDRVLVRLPPRVSVRGVEGQTPPARQEAAQHQC